jgi:hypothetical protein
MTPAPQTSPRPRLDWSILSVGLVITGIILALYAWRTASVVEAVRLQRVASEKMERDHAAIMAGLREILENLRTGR